MKKYFGIILLILISSIGYGQVHKSTKGNVNIFADGPTEDISAKCKTAKAAMNSKTKEVAVSIVVNDFIFSNRLMQEHFQENYMETGSFPHATFDGFLQSSLDSTLSSQTIQLKGTLTVHGVSKERSIPVTFTKTKSGYTAHSTFIVKTAEHNIDVPTIVWQKIGDTVEVSFTFTFKEL